VTACPHCGYGSLGAGDPACPACGKSLEVADVAQEGAATPDRPAHLGVIEASATPPKKKKPRFVSSAGPSLPAKQARTDDTMPSSWMARLDAARRAGVLSTIPEAEPADVIEHAPTAGNGNAPGGTPSSGFFITKPAHLLIAELEEEERAEAEASRVRPSQPMEDAVTELDSITNVQIAKPESKAEVKHLPRWVWALGIGLTVIVVGIFGYRQAFQEPPPEAARALDPELLKQVERRKKAIALLDQGTQHAMMGKEKAPDAIKAYEQALDLEPNLPKAFKGLASVYAAQGDAARAVEHYKMYLKLSPDASDAKQVRGIVEKYESRSKPTKKRKKR